MISGSFASKWQAAGWAPPGGCMQDSKWGDFWIEQRQTRTAVGRVSGRWEDASGDQQLSVIDSHRVIDTQDVDGRASHWGFAQQVGATPGKVIGSRARSLSR